MLFNNCPECCPKNCIILEDNFNRPNNTNLGGDWTEVTGNASIASERLTASGAFLLVTSKEHLSERMSVRATIFSNTTAITAVPYRIIVNYRDSNNYLFVEFDFVFSGVSVPLRTEMKFYRRSGGVETQVGSTRTLDASNVLASITPLVCYDGVYLSSMGFREKVDIITNGRRAGLQYGGTLTPIFDDFYWYKWDPLNCPSCTLTRSNCVKCPNRLPLHIIIDLGIGGLSAGLCSACNTVSGEYQVSQTGPGIFGGNNPCQWLYEAILCTLGFVDTVDFQIQTELLQTFGGPLYWQSVIQINKRGTPTHHTTVYQSATFAESACDTTPVTLNRVSTSAGGACVGTLPATAQLRLIT